MSAPGLPAPAKRPCGTCPYRRDVPAGIWDASEYAKLAEYDGETFEQRSMRLFFCHKADGHLCAGWIACHDTDHLLALRLHRVDPSVYTYRSPVPVFASGAEARDHGLSGIARPGARARRAILGLMRKRARGQLRNLGDRHEPGSDPGAAGAAQAGPDFSVRSDRT